MSGKTPINRLEVWLLSFHLCKEEDESWKKQNSVAETGWNEQFLFGWFYTRCTVLWFIRTFKLAKHAEKAMSKQTQERSKAG